jgi:hypothetical protein
LKTAVVMAIPNTAPNCCMVLSVPADLPSKLDGAALSPVAVTAGRAIEMPTPAITKGTTKLLYGAARPARETIHAKPNPCKANPGAMSALVPIRSDSAPASGATISGVAVQGRNLRPVASGESPRPNCKY